MLEISTLGGLSIFCEGKPVAGLASRKADALLVYLACTRRPHPREVLADLLWDERSQTRALSNLRVVLSSIRKHLGAYVSISRDSVTLSREGKVRLDVAELDANLATAQQGDALLPDIAEQTADVVSLYKGDFLEGFYPRECRGFENWAVLERERVRAVFERNMQLLLDALIADRRWHDAIEWGERWIAQGQTPEPAYRALMDAYSGLGDLSGVAAVYRRCVDSLRDELGIEPSDQTKETYERLSSGGRPSTSFYQDGSSEPRTPTAENAARVLLGQWRNRGEGVLDVASLAVVYAAREDLGVSAREASLLIHSALHHGVDVQPWLRRAGSPQAATRALNEALARYPKPGVRMQIVDALRGLDGEEAADALQKAVMADDSPEIRAAAAVAAAEKGRLVEVVMELLDDLKRSNSAATLAALVAVADRFGLPEDIGPYPKFPVGVALARLRWQGQKPAILRQTVRGLLGAALALSLHGAASPFFIALTFPSHFREWQQFTPVPAWSLSGAAAMMVLGAAQGTASGLAVGMADAVWRGKSRGRWRLLFGGLAGLAYSLNFLLLSLTGLLEPHSGPGVYIPAYTLYGVLLGAALSFVIPRLGTGSPVWKQIMRSVWATVVTAPATILYVILVYREAASGVLLPRIVLVLLLALGLGLALSRGRGTPIKRQANSQAS